MSAFIQKRGGIVKTNCLSHAGKTIYVRRCKKGTEKQGGTESGLSTRDFNRSERNKTIFIGIEKHFE